MSANIPKKMVHLFIVGFFLLIVFISIFEINGFYSLGITIGFVYAFVWYYRNHIDSKEVMRNRVARIERKRERQKKILEWWKKP
tara:strand:- start:471 stop:722 length:252 start_codon:yes stop_codon:yes gene_type:complete